jgi:small subunit ribosomal protein S21
MTFLIPDLRTTCNFALAFIHNFTYIPASQPGKEVSRMVEVTVRDNNMDQALRVLKKKMQREGIYREMKMRKHYEKPSERRVREAGEAVRRARKLARKKSELFD